MGTAKVKPAGKSGPAAGRDEPPSDPRMLPRRTVRWLATAIVATSALFSGFALWYWRHAAIPPDTGAFCRQAAELTGALSAPPEEKVEDQQFREQGLARWFHHHRKPPLFSGLVGLGGAAIEWMQGEQIWKTSAGEAVDPERLANRRADRLLFSAYVVAFVCGLWMLRPAWLILRRLGDDRAALAGLALFALTRIAITFSARPLSETLYCGLFLYAVAMLLDGLLDRRIDGFLSAGMLAGLAFLTRSEALLLLPAVGLLGLIGALRRKLSWGYAVGGLAAFTGMLVLLAAPYVWMISKDDGKFTLRRNAGQLLAHEIGASTDKSLPIGQGQTEAQVVGRHFGRIIKVWPGNFFRAVTATTTRRSSFVGMFMVVVGLVLHRRDLFGWGPWQICGLIYLVVVAQLSVFQPHGRWLLSPIAMLAPLMGLGAVGLAEAIIRWNPAKLAEPRKALAPLLGGFVLIMAVFTTVGVLKDHLNDPGKRVASQAPGGDQGDE